MYQTLIDPREDHLFDDARELAEELHQPAGKQPQLIGPSGRQLDIPPLLFELLVDIVDDLRQGNAILVMPITHQLTTNKAAELLNVSRPHLIKLLETGEIPFSKVGTHRRVELKDLLEYQKQQKARTGEALADLVRQGEELDLKY